MSRKKIILIWIVCLSPFFGFITLMYIVKINTITEFPTNGREEGMVYFSDLENPDNNLATVVYSSDGVILGRYFEENRSNVHYTEIAPVLIDALISTEDIRFSKHSGIDVRSLFRATYGALSGNSGSGGASTISQQLSKMLFTKKPSSGIDRVKQKLKEWVVAIELEKRYSKKEIIEMYLNKFDWINQAVGISSASKIYFNIKPNELTTNQSAMLVGMLKNPSLYNPKRNPEGTKNRRNVVLSQMMKNDIISKAEFDSLKVLKLGLDFQTIGHNEGPAPYFREQIRKELKEWCSTHTKPNGEHYNIYTDGLKVYTTIDSRIQKHAEQAVKEHMRVLQQEFYEVNERYYAVYEGKRTPYPKGFGKDQIEELINDGIKRSERYRNLKNQGKSDSEIEDIFNKKIPMTLFSWEGEKQDTLSPRDSVFYNKFFLHTGLMSMDPNTGHVKAYVGGINHKFFKYDHVLQGKRQVGSTFKPFVYAQALEDNKITPCQKITNSSVIFNKDKWNLPEEDWMPENSSSEFNELELSVKFGLANSINMMTASIIKEYGLPVSGSAPGPEAVVKIARKMGVTSDLNAVPSICLGSFEMSVKEITAAYSTFVNQGVYVEPIFITKITDKNGIVLEEFSPKQDHAIKREVAATMVSLLKGVVQGVRSEEKYLEDNKRFNNYKGDLVGTRGTGYALRDTDKEYKLGKEIGGKTGTTQNKSDGWFVGISPNLVTAVWVGCEDRAAHFIERGKGFGSHTSLPIFGKFMRYIFDDEKITSVTEEDKFKDNDMGEKMMNCNEKQSSEEFDEQFTDDDDKY